MISGGSIGRRNARLGTLFSALVVVALAAWPFPELRGQDAPKDSPTDLASFLKDFESEAATISSKEARWVRKEFSEDLAAAQTLGHHTAIVEMVEALKAFRVNTSGGLLGYAHGVSVLIRSGDWSRLAAWHGHIEAHLDSPKRRTDLQNYLATSAAFHASGLLHDVPAATWYYRGGSTTLILTSEGSPLVECTGGVLVCLSKGDSLRIHEAEGAYDLFSERWVGTSGRVPWERTTREGELEGTLRAHEIRLKGSTLLAKDVVLTSTLFEAPLTGELTFKVQNENDPSRRTYPRFETQQGSVKLANVFPGVSFEGGLAIRGSKLAGTSTGDRLAITEFAHADSLFIRCLSQEVQFTASMLSMDHARFTLYLGNDSIHHPDISVSYAEEAKLFRATRQLDGVGMQPFVDSYHAVEFEVEVVEWTQGAPTVKLKALPNSTAEAAVFRSLDCFELDVYNAMMGIDPIHPLSELGRYLRDRGVETFYSEEYADYLRLPEEQARMLLIGLTNAGYVDLDVNTRYVEVKPRATRHLLCKKGAIDYDVLALYSRPRGDVNATLSLNNRLLHLEGVGQVQVSEAQDVLIQPYGGAVALGKNRDFAFDGVINAGKFELSGTGFEFNYDGFKVGIHNAESLRIRVELDGQYDSYGKRRTRWVTSTIEEVTGTLEIDHPKNKSGWKSEVYTQYPILTSREIAHVYYDSRAIQGGAYHRDRFNYALDPFVIDSLDNFRNEDLRFTGELLSGGIVPDLVEPLRLMEDYSLGFTRQTPPSGWPLYEGAGTLVAQLALDGKGLHGPGQIDFLTSTIVGDDHVYLPDSTFGVTTTYRNERREGLLPQVDADVAQFGLHPKAGRLDVRSTPLDSLQFFGEDVRLVGGLHMWAERMTGEGTFHFERAALSSRGFSMGEHLIDADVAAFSLVGTDLNEVAFGTDNVSAHVDFDERRGDFRSIDGATLIDLPAIRYECLMDEFSWYMDEDRLDLVNSLLNPEGMTFRDLSNRQQSNFFSLDQDQDSLHFLSPRATYKVDEAFVHCHEVKSIAVADAEIRPNDGEVIVRREAQMDLLKEAEVFANDVTRYHRLTDATIQINGRLSYEGAGTKVYKDALGVEWPIRFHELSVDTASRTVGRGRIGADADFFLSPRFAFRGTVNLEAGREHLEFDGGAQMQFDCDDFANEWVEFVGVIDPQDVAIPIDSVVTEMGKAHLGVGWVYNEGGIASLYQTFFTKKPVRDDVNFMVPRGNLRYDKRRNRFVVCSDEKLKNSALPGTLVELSLPGCEVSQQGATSFPTGRNTLVQNTFVGDVFAEGDVMKLRGGLVLDMPVFPEVIAEHLQERLRVPGAYDGLGAFATNYRSMLNEWLGVDEAAALELELNALGEFKKSVPDDVQFPMVFHGLNWEYDRFEDMWVTVGDLGIATLGKHNVWRSVRGKIAFSRDSDILHIYLHLDGKNWFYLEWNSTLGSFSIQSRELALESEERLSSKLAELKPSDLKFNEGGKRMTWNLASEQAVNKRRFVELFREFDTD